MPNKALASDVVAAIFHARGQRCLSRDLGGYTKTLIATKEPIAGERLAWKSNGGAKEASYVFMFADGDLVIGLSLNGGGVPLWQAPPISPAGAERAINRIYQRAREHKE